MIIDESTYLAHYGTPHQGSIPHSGRYEYGSGERPDTSLSDKVKEMKSQGISEKDISKALNMSTREMKARVSDEVNAAKSYDINRAKKMAQHGNSIANIAKEMGISENTARTYVNYETKDYKSEQEKVKTELLDALKTNKYVDVGLGAEGGIAGGVTKTRLENSVKALVASGDIVVNKVQVDNLAAGPGKKTTITVISKNEGKPSNEVSKDIYDNLEQIGVIGVVKNTSNGEIDYQANIKPVSIDSKRVQAVHDLSKDGTIEIRPGVKDLSLGSNRYAQVRIAVDGTHFLKGVAVYNDDLPDGIDIRFNHNKGENTPMMSSNPDEKQVLKPLKSDPLNPFGATIKYQTTYEEKGETKKSAINIVNEEGTWDEWSKSLPSQFLSKQSAALITQQLDQDIRFKQEELDEIKSLENPEIKKAMLEDFAGSCDSSAEHLRGAALPRQKTQLLIAVPEMKDNEIYAPNFENGERVCLVRYPHAGTFEIPELIVNNKDPNGLKTVGKGMDAVGVNQKVAEQLSGADFDGDTVVVLPNNKGMIKSSAPIKELLEFDNKNLYSLKERRLSGDPTCPPKMTAQQKGMEMGLVSNLITDMTFQGASQSEIVRAVKHSMVVIDAEKHDLDYRQSYEDNDIRQLQEKYQGRAGGGAGTIVSRSTGQALINERRAYSKINKDTGEVEYSQTGDKHWMPTDKTKRYQKAHDIIDNGGTIQDVAKALKVSESTAEKYTQDFDKEFKEVANTQTVSKMSIAKDAKQLMSGYNVSVKDGELVSVRNNNAKEGNDKEFLYAQYANKCKAMANEARKEAMATQSTKYSKTAKEEYASEVAKLTAQVHDIEKNRPIERRASALANIRFNQVMSEHPEYKNDKDKIKKEKQRAVKYGREIAGSKASQIKLTEREFEAIKAGAFSSTMIKKIIDYSDSDHFKSLATPKQTITLSDAKISRIESLAKNGATYAEIASVMGCSTSTIAKALNNK